MMRWFLLNVFPGVARDRTTGIWKARPLVLPAWLLMLTFWWLA